MEVPGSLRSWAAELPGWAGRVVPAGAPHRPCPAAAVPVGCLSGLTLRHRAAIPLSRQHAAGAHLFSVDSWSLQSAARFWEIPGKEDCWE